MSARRKRSKRSRARARERAREHAGRVREREVREREHRERVVLEREGVPLPVLEHALAWLQACKAQRALGHPPRASKAGKGARATGGYVDLSAWPDREGRDPRMRWADYPVTGPWYANLRGHAPAPDAEPVPVALKREHACSCADPCEPWEGSHADDAQECLRLRPIMPATWNPAWAAAWVLRHPGRHAAA